MFPRFHHYFLTISRKNAPKPEDHRKTSSCVRRFSVSSENQHPPIVLLVGSGTTESQQFDPIIDFFGRQHFWNEKNQRQADEEAA